MKVGEKPAYRITGVSPIYPTHNNSRRSPYEHYTQNKSKDAPAADTSKCPGTHIDYLV